MVEDVIVLTGTGSAEEELMKAIMSMTEEEAEELKANLIENDLLEEIDIDYLKSTYENLSLEDIQEELEKRCQYRSQHIINKLQEEYGYDIAAYNDEIIKELLSYLRYCFIQSMFITLWTRIIYNIKKIKEPFYEEITYPMRYAVYNRKEIYE